MACSLGTWPVACQARDVEMRPLADGGVRFSVSLVRAGGRARARAHACARCGWCTGETISGEVSEEADGSYTAAYQPARAGVFRLCVMLGEDHIQASPFVVTVAEGQVCTELSEGLYIYSVYGLAGHYLHGVARHSYIWRWRVTRVYGLAGLGTATERQVCAELSDVRGGNDGDHRHFFIWCTALRRARTML